MTESLHRILPRRQAIFVNSLATLFLFGFGLLWMDLRRDGLNLIEMVILLLFVPLFLQLSFGALVALAGFVLLSRIGDPVSIGRLARARTGGGRRPATAIIMPIFNEDVARVFQGVRAMFDSLEATGQRQGFDFYILSDSNDPDHWIEEEQAWVELCRAVGGFGRIFYRKRRITLHQKSGNVSDFCRRWGARYRYMIVLDADSVMSGGALVRLVDLMEGRPSAGIIQAVPRQVLARSLFGRIQQFAARIYGPVFAVGSNYWHGGTGTYWGHNAIIRVQPFMKHCALPEVPKAGPLSGRFLSHDSVEAALMRAAGYGVWLAYDLEESYEEGPPDVLASLQRDRRWCLGNLQHATLLFQRHFRSESRVHLMLGIMSYLSAPIWLLFIVLAVVRRLVEPAGPESAGFSSTLLLSLVALLLLLPKVLGLAHALRLRTQDRAGSAPGKLCVSVSLETVFSTLFAAIQMVFHTFFVLAALLRIPTLWTRQNRGDSRPAWGVATQRLGVLSVIGILAGWQIYTHTPGLFAWSVPVLASLVLAVPFCQFTSARTAGEWARRWGLFVVPEEVDPPPVLQQLATGLPPTARCNVEDLTFRDHQGLLQVAIDPYINALHVTLLRSHDETPPEKESLRDALVLRLLVGGPKALSREELFLLLWDAEALITLHHEVWCGERGTMATEWVRALHQYNRSREETDEGQERVETSMSPGDVLTAGSDRKPVIG